MELFSAVFGTRIRVGSDSASFCRIRIGVNSNLTFFQKISVQNIENYDNYGGGQVMGREGQEESTEQEALFNPFLASNWYVKNIVGSGLDKH